MAPRSHRILTTLSLFACTAVGVFGSISALGAVVEPDGTKVPIDESLSNDYWDKDKPMEQRVIRPQVVGLQSMFNLWEGLKTDGKPAVNAYEDGSSTNVVFSPLCGLNGAMILRGGACQVDFGWYCIDDAPGKEIIHPLVTKADIVKYHDETLATLPGKPPPPPNSWIEYKNNDKGFVPTIQSGYLKAVQGTSQLQDVRNTTDYKNCKSGKIGFAFQGNPTTICPMSKFSQPERNQSSTFDGKPWVSAIVYQSKKNAGTFYLAFEDMPTSTTSFMPTLSSVQSAFPQMTSTSSGWQSWKNDGDFNDFVFKVEGILCQGGGKTCTPTKADGTPWQGACSLGVTACSSDPNAAGPCQQRVQPTAETCNGWDDDCNGLADDGDGLCQAGYVCDNGKCVSACGSMEFKCTDSSLSCQTSGRLAGYCVETACLTVDCPVGQRCEKGACVGGCDNRVCPTDTECIAGNCIDLCAGVTCPASFVCERGACIPDCKCLPCTDSKKSYCDTKGRCIEESCKDVTCEAYKSCVGGSCVDPCASEPCGAGVLCTATSDGKATCAATSTTGTGGTSSIGPNIGTTGSTTGTTGTDAVGSTSSVGQGGGSGATQLFNTDNSGCLCRVAGAQTNRGLSLLAMLGLATSQVLRLRRRLRRQG